MKVWREKSQFWPCEQEKVAKEKIGDGEDWTSRKAHREAAVAEEPNQEKRGENMKKILQLRKLHEDYVSSFQLQS